MTGANQPIESYEDFLRAAIRRKWDAENTDRDTLLAFLFASRESWGVAWDASTRRGIARPVVAIAAGFASAGLLLRLVSGGRLARAVAGASLLPLVVRFLREKDAVRARVHAVSEVIASFRTEFDALHRERRTRPLREGQWELMMEGLSRRFFDALEETSLGFTDPSSAGGYREYVPIPTDRPPRR